jgi:hypothetical protein
MRTDPTDNGGLFIGRRPGTAPIRYRALPTRGTPARQAIDRTLAMGLLGFMVLICLTFWGPLPAAWLWVGSQVDYQTDSVSVGILSAFVGLLASYLVGLVALKRLDHAWVLVRRAAGYDQRSGTLSRLFAITAVVGTCLFLIWLFIIQGPGSELGPANGF